MVLPAFVTTGALLAGHLGRIGVTSASARGFTSQFVQSLPFGAGYSLGTYLGFPKNYQSKSSSIGTTSVNLMPYNRYGRYYRRRRYSRYGRYGRRYYRKYRRF